MEKILIIDDDEMFCDVLSDKIGDMGHEAFCSFTLSEGCRRAEQEGFDVVYLDVRLPDGNGLDKLQFLHGCPSAPEVIIITGAGDPDGAELAIKNGAWDYVEKLSTLSSMVLPLVRALQYREIKTASRQQPALLKRDGIVGKSPHMQACLEQIVQAAGSDAGVLISGETGTGKELAAWAIHNNSERAKGNFVVVDCAALSESLVEGTLFGYEKGAYTGADKAHSGLIRQADGGTLFLDEVGELPFSIQRSFLRVLQERRFRPLGGNEEVSSNFRLIAATNQNLEQMVAKGNFRNDLLYRLRSFHIEIPPLRSRREDIAELAHYHASKVCECYGMENKTFSPEMMQMLQTYTWPGNVRELVNVLMRSIAVARHETMLIPHHLPAEVRIQVTRARLRGKSPAVSEEGTVTECLLPTWQDFRREALPRMENQYLLNLLSRAGDSISRACEISGLSRSRLYELLKKHGLVGPAGNGDAS